MKELTCGNCTNVVKTKGFIQVIGCSETGCVIPHKVDYDTNKVVFWRVPMECPRPSTEVIKSEDQASATEWVTGNLNKIPFGGECNNEDES